MQNPRNKGQVAIWFIIAFVIVAIILGLFFLNKQGVSLNPLQGDVGSSVDKCIKDAVNEGVDKMLPQGGFIEPMNYKVYKNIKVTYLCQNIGYFKPCINQHPLLISEEINELENYTMPIIEQCFSDFKAEMEKRNYDVVMTPLQSNISLASNRVFVNIDREVTTSKNGQTQKFSNYDIEIINPLYDLSKVAIEIANQEAKYCYFEYVGYMLLYPKIDIQKFAFSDSTKIYTIKDKESEKEINIAIRSCAIPPGI